MKQAACVILLLTVLTASGYTQPVSESSGGDSSIETSMQTIQWLGGSYQGVNEFSFWGGYAFDSFRLWGKTPDATIGQLGLGYNRKFLKIGNQLFKYRFSLNLFSKITYPEFEPSRNRASLSGFGITPLGLRINFVSDKQLQPFVDFSGGMIVFDEPFPDSRGKKFNYTLGLGGGLEYMVNSGASLSFGYRYFHISNGERGQVNPGIDSSFFFFALTIF